MAGGGGGQHSWAGRLCVAFAAARSSWHAPRQARRLPGAVPTWGTVQGRSLDASQKGHCPPPLPDSPPPARSEIVLFLGRAASTGLPVEECGRPAPPALSALHLAPAALSWDLAKDLAFLGKHSLTCPPNPSLPSFPS